MRVALIGAGRMGQTLARLFSEAGHDVVLTNSRGPDSLAELTAELGPKVSAASVADAVTGVDVVVLATTWDKTGEAVAPVEDWSGKLVVDATNNRSGPGPQGVIDIGGQVSSVVVAELVPGAQVVKAFNHQGIPVLAASLGANAGEANALFVSGDDAQAKAVVSELIASIGGEAVDAGDLAGGGKLQGTDGPLSGNPLEMLTPTEARALLARARADAGVA